MKTAAKSQAGPRRPSASIAFYVISVLLILGSMALLFGLLRTFERDLQSRITQLQRVFADPYVLKHPTERQIRFSVLEELVAKYRDDSTFPRFTVSKVFENDGERIVYPFFAPALFPAGLSSAPTPSFPEAGNLMKSYLLPWSVPNNVQVLPLKDGEVLLGRLFVEVNERALNIVRAVIASLSVLLVGAVGLLSLQFRKQEKVISRTTVELEEKRRELVRIERLAMAGQLSANILHDLKKPVLNIKSEAEELETDGPPASFAALAGRLREQVELFFGILRDSSFERFVRAHSEREYVDVNELLDRSLGLVRYERGSVEVERRFDEKLSSVLAEPVRIVQVFSNLILNAFQAMEGAGSLELTTFEEPPWVVITIADSGPGIKPEMIDQIFVPFFTTKPEGSGTGLGLYITRDIIQELGGTIEVKNRSGRQGTVFTIRLPIPEV